MDKHVWVMRRKHFMFFPNKAKIKIKSFLFCLYKKIKDSNNSLKFLFWRTFVTAIFRYFLLTCWQWLLSWATTTSVHTVLQQLYTDMGIKYAGGKEGDRPIPSNQYQEKTTRTCYPICHTWAAIPEVHQKICGLQSGLATFSSCGDQGVPLVHHSLRKE